MLFPLHFYSQYLFTIFSTSGEGSDDDEGGIQGYRDPETSSHNSAKSEKNLEDFVDEDESCEEELARLAQVTVG